MSEHNSRDIPKDKKKKETNEMCASCIHKSYCMVAYKKEHWCGNYKSYDK